MGRRDFKISLSLLCLNQQHRDDEIKRLNKETGHPPDPIDDGEEETVTNAEVKKQQWLASLKSRMRQAEYLIAQRIEEFRQKYPAEAKIYLQTHAAVRDLIKHLFCKP